MFELRTAEVWGVSDSDGELAAVAWGRVLCSSLFERDLVQIFVQPTI
jgi:hypothetical protein